MMVEVDENFELTCIHGPKGVCVCVSVCVLIAAGKVSGVTVFSDRKSVV